MSERIVGLDGLRGVAILLVLSVHLCTGLTGHERLTGEPWLSLLYAGNTGVTLFFILSGFLVSAPFIKSAQARKAYPLGEYVVQRALRILPPYYVVAFFGIIITQNFDQILPVLLFSSYGYSLGAYSAVWWSLSAEIQFYFLVPLVFYIAHRRRRMPLLFFALLVAVIYLSIIFGWNILPGQEEFALRFRWILSVFGQLPAFLAGMGMSLIYYKVKKPGHNNFLMEHVCILALLAVLSWLLLPVARMGAVVHMWHKPWYIIFETLVWSGVIWVILGRSTTRDGLLDNYLTRYLGRISFSLYLVHMPIIKLVASFSGALGLWPSVILASMLSIAVAQALYWLVEEPSLTLKKQLLNPHQLSGAKA